MKVQPIALVLLTILFLFVPSVGLAQAVAPGGPSLGDQLAKERLKKAIVGGLGAGGICLVIFLMARGLQQPRKVPKERQCPWCGGLLAGTFEKCRKCGSPVAWVNGLPRKGQ